MTIFNPNDTSINFRDKIFEVFKPMLKDYWITGIGLGTGDPNKTFMKLIQNYPLTLVNPNGNYVPPHTHVLYYQIWIETGIIGIVSFLWMIIRLYWQSMVSIFRKIDEKANNIIIAGISGLAGCLLIGTKEYIWFYPRTMVFFFVNMGIIYAAIAITKKKRETFTDN
jgi:O-antigen ligase